MFWRNNKPVYSIREKIDYYKIKIMGTLDPEEKKHYLDRIDELKGFRKPNSILVFQDKDVFDSNSNKIHSYFVNSSYMNNVRINQLTSVPQDRMELKSLKNNITGQRTFGKFFIHSKNPSGERISYLDAYTLPEGVPKLSPKEAYKMRKNSEKFLKRKYE